MPYVIREVDGVDHADIIHRFNALAPDIFPPLQPRHLENGFWWLAYLSDGCPRTASIADPIAFAGLVAFEPFPRIGYLKRAFVWPDHRGHGLQSRFMTLREAKAKSLGWTHLVSECAATNHASAANFARAGFSKCDPEQKWGAPNSIYWMKQICQRSPA